MNLIDLVKYRNKSNILKVADYILTPLRTAIGGRITYLDDIHCSTQKTKSIVCRIFAAIAVFFILPLELSALGIKFCKRDEWRSLISQDKKTMIDNRESSSSKLLSKEIEDFKQKTEPFSANIEKDSKLGFVYDDPKLSIYQTLAEKRPDRLKIDDKEWIPGNLITSYKRYLSKKHLKLHYDEFVEPTYFAGRNVLIDRVITDLKRELSDSSNKDASFYSKAFSVGGNHYVLVFVDKEKRTVEYYDSLKNYGEHDEVVTKLKIFAQSLSEGTTEKPYNVFLKIEKRLQLDSFQCGAWISFFLEKRLENSNVDFNQLDIEKSQKMIAGFRFKMMALAHCCAIPLLNKTRRELGYPEMTEEIVLDV